MSTGILILNFNNSAATVNCIDSIEQHNTASVKYIVVDNGSTKEGTVSTLDGYFKERFGGSYGTFAPGQKPEGPLPKVSFLLNPTNAGYAVGNNIGLELACKDSEIDGILLLNNDILFVEDILPTLIEDAATVERCGLITPLLLNRTGKEIDDSCARKFAGNWNLMVPFLLHRRDWFGWITKANERRKLLTIRPELARENGPFPIDYPSGSCLYIPKETFREVGGFDPETFLYYEEIILYKKLKALGCQCYCDPRIRVIHLGGNSTRMSNKAFLQRCNLESADVYFRKYGDCSLAQKAVWELTKATWRLRLHLKEKRAKAKSKR